MGNEASMLRKVMRKLFGKRPAENRQQHPPPAEAECKETSSSSNNSLEREMEVERRVRALELVAPVIRRGRN